MKYVDIADRKQDYIKDSTVFLQSIFSDVQLAQASIF